MRTRLPLIILMLLVAVVAFAGKHEGKQVRYEGPHPIPKEAGGGYCHIEVPHVHIYTPANVKLEYRDEDDGYEFVGDPIAYGWDGPKTAYYGHHPIETEDGHVEYCYIDGPHYHDFAPSADLKFELQGGAYWYVGDLPQAYVDARPTYDPIDTVYVKAHYDRPVVVVDSPPVAWVGLRYTVAAPEVVVHADLPPPPRVEVVEPHVVAGVQVTAPSLTVEVGVPTLVVGGGVIVEHDHRDHWRHDNGRHEGWHKHGGRGHWKHW